MSDDPAVLAEHDQRLAAARHDAESIATFYATLVTGKVPPDLAADLTKTWALPFIPDLDDDPPEDE